MGEPVIHYNSDEAAKPHTMSGWVSRKGHFYADESIARYDGCTHRPCQTCGELTEKHWTACKECRAKTDDAKWLAMPHKDWKEEPVVIHRSDTYFFGESDFLDWCIDNERKPEDVKLVICEPMYAQEIDPDEHYADQLPEDMYLDDIAPELAKAFEALNKVIREGKFNLSCWAGEHRTSYKPKAET